MPSISNNILLNISRGYYKYIGEGSSRIVYDLGNRYVLKVAKNLAGIAQNKSEYKISSYDETNLFAKSTKLQQKVFCQQYLVLRCSNLQNNRLEPVCFLRMYSYQLLY